MLRREICKSDEKLVPLLKIILKVYFIRNKKVLFFFLVHIIEWIRNTLLKNNYVDYPVLIVWTKIYSRS